MAGLSYNVIDKYIVNAVCTAPLHIGSAVGDKGEVLVHPVDNLPFIQASSISGVLRSTSEKVNGPDVTDRMFGYSRISSGSNANDFSSRVRISDGKFVLSTVKMEYRPRVAINPETGSVNTSDKAGSGRKTGHKFEMESIGSGAEFRFTVYLYDGTLRQSLEKVMAELKAEHVQIGGQKSNGEGYISLKSLYHHSFDMKDAKARKDWAGEANLPEKEYTDITNRLNDSQTGNIAYTITLKGKTEGSLLVKGIAVEPGKDAPDAENLRNADQEYIIPGSSLKGVLKSRTQMIARKLNREFLIGRIYGQTGDKSNRGNAGCISVKDTIVGTREANDMAPIQHRIHIDKFTGGVINAGLFSEKNICGNLQMSIRITAKKEADAAAGLMILALRDLAAGLINVGSGYNVGKGFIQAEEIVITSAKGEKAVIDMKTNQIKDPAGIITACLQAVANAKEGR